MNINGDKIMKENLCWIKPELTILVRNKPEENILSNCKTDSIPSGSNSADSACLITGCGGDCETVGSS